jgi:hypothetical protein
MVVLDAGCFESEGFGLGLYTEDLWQLWKLVNQQET